MNCIRCRLQCQPGQSQNPEARPFRIAQKGLCADCVVTEFLLSDDVEALREGILRNGIEVLKNPNIQRVFSDMLLVGKSELQADKWRRWNIVVNRKGDGMNNCTECPLFLLVQALLSEDRESFYDLNIERIKEMVATQSAISVKELESRSRKRDIVQARKIAMKRCRELNITFDRIGNAFNRSHSTVMNAIKP